MGWFFLFRQNGGESRGVSPLSLGFCCVAIAITACDSDLADPSNRPADNGQVGTQRSRSASHVYRRPPTDVLLRVVRTSMGAQAPESIGSGVIITTRAPSAQGAHLFLFAASHFDPNYGMQGVSGNGSGSNGPGSVLGINIQPASNKATLVDCDIAGAPSMRFSTQTFDASNQYQGDVTSGVLESSNPHWTFAIPWDDAYAPRGFRLLMKTQGTTDWDFWGCSIIPL